MRVADWAAELSAFWRSETAARSRSAAAERVSASCCSRTWIRHATAPSPSWRARPSMSTPRARLAWASMSSFSRHSTVPWWAPGLLVEPAESVFCHFESVCPAVAAHSPVASTGGSPPGDDCQPPSRRSRGERRCPQRSSPFPFLVCLQAGWSAFDLRARPASSWLLFVPVAHHPPVPVVRVVGPALEIASQLQPVPAKPCHRDSDAVLGGYVGMLSWLAQPSAGDELNDLAVSRRLGSLVWLSGGACRPPRCA